MAAAVHQMHESGSSPQKEKPRRFLFGSLHIETAMKLLAGVGILVILGLVVLLYFKFRKAMFVLLLPTSISALTVAAIISKREKLVWPIIAISMFHMILASYALIIFSFYFIFKPFYIIMVLNWAFDTLHTDKTPSYYIQCTGIFVFLFSFISFNLWQAHVAVHFKDHVDTKAPPRSHQPTVLVVNKQAMF
ncbi:unnamed protein product [Caenorhabditis auriculariae]|uniref:Uncharacterized protein n=1 Tax=Caenorhabditis auriculariae TaxID=2777116 RepID=A0A8S1HXN1_9PELO|nr:unnamed protein product [Caenorhabditis auriculariae]